MSVLANSLRMLIFTVHSSVGDLRFNLPVAVDSYNGTRTVTSYGPGCPQQAFDFPQLDSLGLAGDAVEYILNSLYNVVSPSAEDCKRECSSSDSILPANSPRK